ncbi:hypothetical protein RH915_04265 [Serpentinicella sp. ANB-PHB4]|uniref:hypothetical protein n=1 Tax=Serpentinicella sp. ANB-PHB4 TaxID=3074076 RepID=UPI00285B7AF5|nr:hypothetical protein [Serpentinicella sp. ANB-PHB4]MDR5658697.1 hypothetical protein [Serpentinicella sp. ANB-PHB4]
MKRSTKIVLVALILIFAFTSGVFASQNNLFQMIRNRVKAIETTYTENISLEKDGKDAQAQLKQHIDDFEMSIAQELDNYEAELKNNARQTLQNEVLSLTAQMDDEKEEILHDIKEKMQKEFDQALQKELRDLEKAIRKNN